MNDLALMNARRAGVLLHPTSLPGGHGIGDLGSAAFAFVDWLVQARATAWQVLPLVPVGGGNSPYSSPSALALEPLLISLDALAEDGLLDANNLAGGPTAAGPVDYAAARAFKTPRLVEAARRLWHHKSALRDELEAFVASSAWARQHARFLALKQAHADRAFWTWQDNATPNRDAEQLALALQFLAERQWLALKRYANARGVALIGDLPIYVDLDSVEVWSQPAQFQLDAKLQPRAVAGVPPDYFSEAGQLWGNPLYDWQAMARDGYRFWIERMQRALQLYDVVRIDHFRALSAYWAVPAGAKDARGGAWQPGPGRALFDAMRTALGSLPIIAEDLGTLDDAVHALRAAVGLPGMAVLQFAFGGQADNAYLPHNINTDAVVYTGTHDNDTTLGFWQRCDERTRDHVRRYFGIDGHDIAWSFIRAALASRANTAIVPAQDLLILDGAARMNTPGVSDGNWTWRLSGGLPRHAAERMAGLVELYARC